VFLTVNEDIQVAHRLSLTPGKCQNIHGHSMNVQLSILCYPGMEGIACNNDGDPLELGDVKDRFRKYLKDNYDHRLLLNENDPWAGYLVTEANLKAPDQMAAMLPGLTSMPGDPTVENIAQWIGEWAAKEYHTDIVCHIDETKTNGVQARIKWNGFGAKLVHP
jgi:6-pyruvoyltetrahydropterin/6-carboxytetrahydropterin synthase